jgi:hypothetical protein
VQHIVAAKANRLKPVVLTLEWKIKESGGRERAVHCMAIDLARKYHESRYSGAHPEAPESSPKPANTLFRMPLDTGFRRYEVYIICSPHQ